MGDSLIFLFLLILGCIIVIPLIIKYRWRKPRKDFTPEQRQILVENVSFYNALTNEEKQKFEYRVSEFNLNYTYLGIKTTVNEKDKILIAASAIIPIFSFPNWRYNRLKEIRIFPNNFNRQFRVGQDNSIIRGLVGFGYLEGKLLVSRPALYQGYEVYNDRRNTCLHEFVHLIDMDDGTVDGVPEKLLQHKYVIPWLYIMRQEVIRIKTGYSDINDYATKNTGEFLAVVSEYFFERPEDFKNEHPRLFNVMNEIFKPTKSISRRSKTKNNY